MLFKLLIASTTAGGDALRFPGARRSARLTRARAAPLAAPLGPLVAAEARKVGAFGALFAGSAATGAFIIFSSVSERRRAAAFRAETL